MRTIRRCAGLRLDEPRGADAVWLPYTPVPTFTLSPGTATKRVYLQLRNDVGATSAVRSDTIVLYQ
jgi:hypothetical protein